MENQKHYPINQMAEFATTMPQFGDRYSISSNISDEEFRFTDFNIDGYEFEEHKMIDGVLYKIYKPNHSIKMD